MLRKCKNYWTSKMDNTHTHSLLTYRLLSPHPTERKCGKMPLSHMHQYLFTPFLPLTHPSLHSAHSERSIVECSTWMQLIFTVMFGIIWIVSGRLVQWSHFYKSKLKVFFFFFCHKHSYTEYNQQWNVFSAFNPSKCTHTWSSGQPMLQRPGSSWGFGALLKGLTSVVERSCRSRDSSLQPQVTSPTRYPLGHV